MSEEREPHPDSPVIEAIAALEKLRASTNDDGAEEAYQLALCAITHLGTPMRATARIKRAFNVLFGGRPDDDDGIRIRQCAQAMSVAVAQFAVSPTAATAIARQILTRIDPALATADLSPLVARVAQENSMSGVIADLLLSTGAIGVNPRTDRTTLQKRVDAALKAVPP